MLADRVGRQICDAESADIHGEQPRSAADVLVLPACPLRVYTLQGPRGIHQRSSLTGVAGLVGRKAIATCAVLVCSFRLHVYCML